MSTMIESPTLRPHAPAWIGIALAVGAVLYVVLQALALADAPVGLVEPPAERRQSVVHPGSTRGDFHDGIARADSPMSDDRTA